MLLNIFIASVLMVATTVIHAGAMMLAVSLNKSKRSPVGKPWRRRNVFWVGGIVILMFLASVVEVLLWAVTFLALNAIEGLEQALYFSMVTFTTLGYGDIVLADQWRLLASFEAVNGIIMFGWTTAVVIAVVQRIYVGEESEGVRQVN
jgi:hypothetical protein